MEGDSLTGAEKGQIDANSPRARLPTWKSNRSFRLDPPSAWLISVQVPAPGARPRLGGPSPGARPLFRSFFLSSAHAPAPIQE